MGSTWKPLPDELSDSARLLTEELRAVKDRSGLSLSEMATATHYSRASWERWLNGKRLITPEGLRTLAACTDADLTRLQGLLDLAAWEAAQSAHSAGEGTDPAATGPSAEGPEERAGHPAPAPASLSPAGAGAGAVRQARTVRPAVLAGAAGVLLVVLAVLVLTTRIGAADGTRSAPAAAVSAVRATLPPPTCQGIGCAGKDPQSTGCEQDDHTITTSHIGTVIIYLHYSPRCQAAWSGVTDGAPGDTATITNGLGDQQTALIHWGYDNYSMMVDAHDQGTVLRVCGVQPDGTGCTPSVPDPAADPSPDH